MDKKWVKERIFEERRLRKEITQKIETVVKEAHNIEPKEKLKY